MRVWFIDTVTNPKQDCGRAILHESGGTGTMFRMIFAIVVGVMEKTPKRERGRPA
jgi:hypothetical protein